MFKGQVTELEIAVSFTHNTVGDLPGIMQETKISPLQSLTCHFVSQFVPAVKEVERDRRMKSKRLYGPILILLRLYRRICGRRIYDAEELESGSTGDHQRHIHHQFHNYHE